jgi:3-hydroxybutyryl-CoA dehydrogenase
MTESNKGENVARIEWMAVIGLGTMGHGIAQTYAMAGCEVRAYDEFEPARQSLHQRVRANLNSFVDVGLLPESEVEPTLARLTVCNSEAEAVQGVDCVTEAIIEDLPAKQALLKRLESLVNETTILASNSSTFPISQSGSGLAHPERAVVTHWFNPPHIVPTVEVVGGPATNESTIEAMIDLLRSAGKLPIRINQELPGFLVNRIQIAIKREVWDLYDRGIASVEDIDAAIQGSMGFRLATMGQLRVDDFGGLDVQEAVYNNLVTEIASGTEIPASVQAIVDAGHYGFKNGEGFYSYPQESAEAIRSERDQHFLQLLKLFYSRGSSDA